MNALSLTLILVSLATFVAGQFLLKASLDETRTAAASSKRRRIELFVGGIASMTVSFFLTLGLLQRLDLSVVFPFQGLSVIIITVGASIFLKERLTTPLVIGSLLITAGVMLVSAS
jgi:drug/metabolite transporter (DMT)-like permease